MSYTYNFNKTDFLNDIINPGRLTQEIGSSTISIALDSLNISTSVCGIVFKAALSQDEQTTLSGIVVAHTGDPLSVDPPIMEDGRPLVRADTRPLETQTYFTSVGDTEDGIGDGDSLMWDFSSDLDIYDEGSLENGPTVASGYKAKRFDIWFNEPVYLKDGTMYFVNAPFGSYISMYITIPAGNFYPNASGTYTSAMLGLSGDDMYAYATKDVLYASYVMKHGMIDSCTMGDELNAEGAQVDAMPAGWHITGIVVTPEEGSENFKGFGSLELYRQYTCVLPGGAKGGEQ